MIALVLIAAAPFAGGVALMLLAVVGVLVLLGVGFAVALTSGRLPRAPRGQFLGPGGPDDPDRPAPRR